MTTKYNEQGFTIDSKEMLELQHKINDFLTLSQQYEIPSIVMIGMLDFAKSIVLQNMLIEFNKQNELQKQRDEFMRSFDSVPKPLN
jgi:hypothetical protein